MTFRPLRILSISALISIHVRAGQDDWNFTWPTVTSQCEVSYISSLRKAEPSAPLILANDRPSLFQSRAEFHLGSLRYCLCYQVACHVIDFQADRTAAPLLGDI